MLPGYTVAGMGKPSPGQWYVGIGEFEGRKELQALQCSEDDFFAASTTVVLLEPTTEAMMVPSILLAPWLAMDKDGDWFAWWYEPELAEDGDWQADVGDVSIPQSRVAARLSILAYWVKMDLSKLPTAGQLDYKLSKRKNPWYKDK